MPRRRILSILITVVTLTGGAVPAAAGETPVVTWNAAALDAVRASRLPPPAVARALAVLHTCMYDAWAAYDPVARGVHHQEKAEGGGPDARARAVSHAAHRVLVHFFPARQAQFDTVLAGLGFDQAAPVHPDAQLGLAAADAGLAARADDGANESNGYADYTSYTPANSADVLADPNRWQPLRGPDGSTQTYALPHWGLVRPFALASGDLMRPGPPAAYPHGSYIAQALALVRLSASLTDREKVIAGYWADGPRTETPPGHWCLFAQFVSQRDGHDLEQDVKLFFALTNALLDASIAVWDAKRFYDSPRPITTVRFLFGDRPIRAWAGPYLGTRVISGRAWTPYIATPPFAEYVSGHSTFSAAAADILRRFTGSDVFGAEATIAAGSSAIEPGAVPVRDITLSWATFTDAADEAGLSRRFGGIHFADSDLQGRAMGREIGALVWDRAQTFFSGAGR